MGLSNKHTHDSIGYIISCFSMPVKHSWMLLIFCLVSSVSLTWSTVKPFLTRH